MWLLVGRPGQNKVSAEDLNTIVGSNPREEDLAGEVAYAILPEEVSAIRDACEVWLDEQEQSLMEKVLGGG